MEEMSREADVERMERRYGTVVVPIAWIALPLAAGAVVASFSARDGRPWSPLEPSLIEGSSDMGPFAIIGVLVVMMLSIATRLSRREPENSLARWMAVFALAGVVTLATDLVGAALVDFTDLTTLGTVVAIASGLCLVLTWWALIIVLLRFPSGRRAGAGITIWLWRGAEWLGGIATLLLAVTFLHTGLLNDEELWGSGDVGLPNPLGVESLNGAAEFGVVGWTLLVPATAIAILSIVVRAVRSTGDERNQLKWVGFGIAFGWGGAALLNALIGSGPIAFLAGDETSVAVVEFVEGLVISAIPLSFVMAMFRYRLYEIDRLIRRTMVYGVVIAASLGVFGVAIAAVGVFAGGSSDAGVAAATLAAALASSPIHRRVRQMVDRRFNRRRAMSIAAVNGLAATIQREIDEMRLADAALQAAQAIAEPTFVSVWIASEAET